MSFAAPMIEIGLQNHENDCWFCIAMKQEFIKKIHIQTFRLKEDQFLEPMINLPTNRDEMVDLCLQTQFSYSLQVLLHLYIQVEQKKFRLL